MAKTIEQQIEGLKKKVAELERQVQERQEVKIMLDEKVVAKAFHDALQDSLNKEKLYIDGKLLT